jgi:2-C-methyl-D-erythritol 2,4-cyclodiphosphate synthase
VIRVGFGYDSHRFDAQRPLRLGGIEIADHPGLLGHSDGDAIAHAVTDAVLGAAAAGDIGQHFPPSDSRWKDADSVQLLTGAVQVVADLGFRVGNVDVTVVCESPRIGPHVAAMRSALAPALGVAEGQVSIKGKSNEGMGWTGSGEGLAVYAVALLSSTAAHEPEAGA